MELFACPVCFEALTRAGGSVRCPNNHNYDLAREGYVNLLTVQNRRSKAPGDNAGMVVSRGRFLDTGCYQPLADALSRAIAAVEQTQALIDLGCGDGYFTAKLGERLPTVYGIDISRPAIKAACRRSGAMHLAVASNARLPVLDHCFDAATVVMAPMSSEVSRILKPYGRLYRVTPGADHLRQLKQQVYAQNRTHERADTGLAGFTLVSARRLTFDFTPGGAELADLIAMTPLRYTSSKQQQDQILRTQTQTLAMTADFWVDEFELTSADATEQAADRCG